MLHKIHIRAIDYRHLLQCKDLFTLPIARSGRFAKGERCCVMELQRRTNRPTGRQTIRQVADVMVHPNGDGWIALRAIAHALVLALLTAGCTGPKALHPGRAIAALSAGVTGELTQPENPAQPSTQNVERSTETELPLPKGSIVADVFVNVPVPGSPAVTNQRTITISEPTVQKTRTVERAGASIGAAQKDTAREMTAKLAALRPVVWVGIAMVLLGIGIAAYPPLRVAVGSMTTAAATIAGGLALIVLPTLIVGHELMIMSGVCGTVALWFLAHRHGTLKGKAR